MDLMNFLKIFRSFFKWHRAFLFLLLAILLMLLWSVIWIQNQVRNLNTIYYTEVQKSDVLRADWGKMMLEKAHLSSSARVRQKSKKENLLNMSKDQRQYHQVIVLPEHDSELDN